MRHFLYIPWTGLGLYGGFRGNRWLRNRIKVFKEFVVPSMEAQTSQNFTIWCSWRPEERNHPYVNELKEYLEEKFPGRVVFTYSGVCFWDDKYSDEEAQERLVTALHGMSHEIVNLPGEQILMTIQPSDDCYHKNMVEGLQKLFKETDYQAIGYKHGYIMNYKTKELHEYNPNTNPPFFTIRFPREIFFDPYKHLKYTGPYKSHEYVGDHMKYLQLPMRGFIVGTHGENISTHFSHPFKGERVDGVLADFGLDNTQPLKLKISLRKAIMRQLPHGWQRKLRYWFGERFYNKFYKFIRS